MSWQLPTYDGTKSYQNLLVGVYGMVTSDDSLRTKDSDSGIQFSPMDFFRSGRYTYSSGGIDNRSSEGNFWESNPYYATYARYLLFSSTYLVPQSANAKGNGFTVRCLVRLVFSQLPTYSDTKSYQNLLVEVYEMRSGYDIDKADSQIHSVPLDFVRSGMYEYSSGNITSHSYGFYWESSPNSTVNADDLAFYTTYLLQRNYNRKGYGFFLRCLVR